MNSASELPEDHSKHDHDSGKHSSKPSKAYSIEEYLDSLVIEKLKRIEAVILENSQLYPAITNLQYTRDLKYLNLSKNATSPYIGNIQMIPYLGKLVKLDISDNGIIKLPRRDFFLKFPQLRILYLHGNALPDETFVPSVSALKSLVYITIFNNPLEKNAARQRLIQLLPKLQGIDFLAVLDWEKSTEVAAPLLEFQIEKAEIKWPVCPVQNSTEETAIMTGVYEEIRTIQAIYARANSIVKIQKFIKGCLLRRKFAVSFLKGYRIKKELILKIYNRWKQRARLQVVMRNILKERGKLELFYSGYRRRARNVQILVKKFAQKLLDHLQFIKNVVKLQRILKKYYGKLFALYKEPLKLFNLGTSRCFYILYMHKTQALKIIATALSRKPQVLGKVRPEEVMDQITESIDINHDIRAIRYQTDVNVKVLPLYQLIRPIMKGLFRVCKPALKGDYFIKNANKISIRMKTRYTLSTQEKMKFRTRKDERDFYFEENYGQLVKISIPDLNILQYILKVILSHNMNCDSPDEAVLVYFDNGIDRVSAAITIQTCYRRYKLLKHSPYRNIFNNIKTMRAIILLQRWIRTSKFRCRMAFLSNVRYYINRIGSRSLYIEEDVYAGLCDLVEANLQRMHLIDQKVKIYLNPQTNEVLVLRNTPRGLPNRPFLPYWIDQIKHPTVERFTTFTEGDIINLLHAGTKISRKVKEDVKYFKIRYPKLENAKYVAAAIALMTFTLKNAGFFIKLIDKKRFKTQLEKHRVYYHSQITKYFGINIEKITDPQAVEAHLAKKRRAFLTKHHANCCFIFTPDQQEFKALAEEAAKEHVYEVKVYCQQGLGQPSYLTKTSKHVLKDYSRVPISVFFIPFTYFAKIAKKGMSEDLFYMFKKMIREKASNKVEEFQLLKNTIKKPSQSIERDPGSDLRQLFIQEMSLRKTFHKTKEIVTMRKEFNENKEKYEETKREGLELARNRTSEQRKETQQKKYMIDVARGAAVQQKIKEGQKLKEEINLKVKQIAEIASLTKKENVREMQQKARTRLSASAAKDSSRVFSAIGMLMSEEGRDEYKKRRESHLSEVKTKVTQIKEKRLEDKAFHVILQELKKPKQDSFLADYDKNLVEQSVSMGVNKIDVSFQSEADKSKTYSKPTHLRFRKLLERHSAQNESDVQDDTMGDDSRIITENYHTKSTEKQRGVEDSPYSANLNVLNVSGSRRARSVLATPGDRLSLPQSSFEMKKGGFRPRLPSLNGRLLEEYYPIARKNEPDMFGL